MNAKEELSQAFQKLNDGNKILEKYQGFLDQATKITSTMSQAEGRSNLPSDKVGDNAILMADLSKKYLELFLQAETYKVDLLKKLLKLDAPYGKILWLRYVEGYKLYEIAEMEHYSYRHVKRIHKLALKEYDRNNFVTQNVP